MQRIYDIQLTPESYKQQNAHLDIKPDLQCPSCFKACRLHRHGFYQRYITCSQGIPILIQVARFLCPFCRRSISYLPDFAFSYRLVNAETLDCFLDGQHSSLDVQRCYELLQRYERRMHTFLPILGSVAGKAFEWIPRPGRPLWGSIKKACGRLAAATRQLVSKLAITMFARYQCHQSAIRPEFVST